MSEREDRFKNIRGHVKDAHDELHHLSKEQREPYPAELAQLDEVIAYAAVVLDATDPKLISTNAFTAIQTAASNISNNPYTALQTGEAYADALLDAVALLPVARGRDIEQQVKDAAANFQRSASQRLNALSGSISTTRKKLEELSDSVDGRASELKQQIDDRATEFDTKLTELDQTIATQRQALDEQMTRQGATFTETQEERSTEFQQALEAFRSDLAQTQNQAQEEVDERVAEIRRMEQESAQLVGAIGLAGTAERYSEEAREQRKIANWLRFSAIVFALGAVVMAVIATVQEEQSPESLVAKLAVSTILGGLAAYAARQSGRHRNREEHARSLQLELTAFSPFIEPLSARKRPAPPRPSDPSESVSKIPGCPRFVGAVAVPMF